MSKDKPKKVGRQNYDWETIKIDYVTTPKSSIKYISEKYGIRERTVAQKCRDDSWLATKKKYLQTVTEKATRKLATKEANRLARLVDVADKVTEQLEKALDDPEQFYRQFVPETIEEDGMTVSTYTDKVSKKVDTKAIKDVLQSVKMLEDINRSLCNIQKAEQLNRDRREDEKLKIEKERWEAEKQRQNLATGDEGSHGVVILPEVMIGDDNNG